MQSCKKNFFNFYLKNFFQRSCARSFHVTCAFYAHVRMELKEMRTKKNPDTIAVNRFVYCHQHSHNGYF